MAMKTKGKSPEEILKEIESLKTQYAAAEAALKESKRDSIAQAVAKAGTDFEEKYKIYMQKKNSVISKETQIAKLRADMQADLQYLADQYKPVRDTLVAEGVKEEYLTEFMGQPPAVKAAKATTAAAGTGGTKVRTKAKLPDGTTKSWIELCKEHNLPLPEKGSFSAHRLWEDAVASGKYPNLPKVEVV